VLLLLWMLVGRVGGRCRGIGNAGRRRVLRLRTARLCGMVVALGNT
jgi:hypothetical protein